ncbi:MAG TPA: hypothetical protein VJ208_03125 [Candidatus Nanoarchaeia archaeon]|nr:hypothetical protein [Candidatus Nanoarchaeia archaeon]
MIREIAKKISALAVASALAVGVVYGEAEKSLLDIEYVGRSGKVSGRYACFDDTVLKKACKRISGNGANYLIEGKDGWHYVEWATPYNKYSQETFKVTEIKTNKVPGDEKPGYVTAKDFAVLKYNVERGLDAVNKRISDLEKKVSDLHKPELEKKDNVKIDIVSGINNKDDIRSYNLGFRVNNLGLIFGWGEKKDENLDRIAINSPTERVLEGSVDRVNQKYMGISGEYNHDFGNWNLLAGLGLREWTEEIRTDERISDNGNVLASNRDSKQNSEKAFTIHTGAGIGTEKLRGEIVAEYDSHLKKTIPGLRVSYKFK